MLVSVYTCQNATLLEITCRGSFLMSVCVDVFPYESKVAKNSKRVLIFERFSGYKKER